MFGLPRSIVSWKGGNKINCLNWTGMHESIRYSTRSKIMSEESWNTNYTIIQKYRKQPWVGRHAKWHHLAYWLLTAFEWMHLTLSIPFWMFLWLVDMEGWSMFTCWQQNLKEVVAAVRIPTPKILPHLLKIDLAREQPVKQTQLTFSGGANLWLYPQQEILSRKCTKFC